MKCVLCLVFAVVFSASAASQTQVFVDRSTPEIFPGTWQGPPVSASASLLPEADRKKCADIIGKALAKYPAQVLNANLKKVYVLGLLEFSGVPAGGTRSRSNVYVVKNERYSEERFEGNFHAEFSSILFLNHAAYLDKVAWQKLNPEGFSYRGSGVKAISKGQASLELRDALHEEGFLNEYSKASLEEDFNSLAGRLFIGDRKLWEVLTHHPRVKAKATLVMAFYAKLDPFFKSQFFESLRRDHAQ